MTKNSILIVEDEAIIGVHLKNTLAGLGYEVAGVVDNAKDAIARCGESRPDLILMDILIPGGMDGIEAAGVIINSYDIPVVYLTGNADMATVSRARETNPYGYIIKPINAQDLFSTIDTALHRHGLEMKLRESEERYLSLFNRSLDCIYVHDVSGNFLDANDAALDLMEYTRDEIKQVKLQSLLSEDQLPAAVAAVSEIVNTGIQKERAEFRLRTKTGRIKYIETLGSGIYHDGKLHAIQGIARDITDRKIAEEAMRESDAKHRLITEMMSDVVWTTDANFRVTYMSPSVEKVTGFTAEEHMAHQISEIIAPESLARVMEQFAEEMRKDASGGADPDRVVNIECEHFRKDGSTVMIEDTVKAIRDGEGRIIGLHGVSRDITRGKLAIDALKQSEEKFRALFDQASAGVFMYDRDLVVLDCNQQFADIIKAPREKIIGLNLNLLKEKGITSGISDALDGKPVYYEGPYLSTITGFTPWISSTVSPLRGPGGNVIGGIGVVIDITNLKKTEETLKKRDEVFRAVFDQSPAGIVLFSRDLVVTDCNRRYEEIMRSTREKIVGFDMKNLRDRTVFPAIREALDGKTSFYEGPYITTTSGITLWVSFSASPIRDINDEVTGAMIVAIDLTERWKAKEALRESEERYRDLFDNANDIIFTLDLNGKYTSFNKQALVITGYTFDEAATMTISDIVAPEYRDLSWKMLKKKLEKGESTTYEVELQAKDGRRIPLEVITQLMIKDGRPVGIQGIGRDITERKLMEEQIRKSLREKETLLKEVHHRVKNNFQVIMSLINLQSSSIENSELQKSFDDTQKRIRSMALVHELLYQSEDISRVDISIYIATIVNELYAGFHGGMMMNEPRVEAGRIDLTIDQAIPCGLIINELVTNALKYAFPPGWKGKPEMTVSVTEREGMVNLVVSDNGVGMPGSIDIGSIRTLGLSLVPMLAKQLSGTMDLDRTRGTRFTIRFPRK